MVELPRETAWLILRVLREAEWAGYNGHSPCCPSCGCYEPDEAWGRHESVGHPPDCELARAREQLESLLSRAP